MGQPAILVERLRFAYPPVAQEIPAVWVIDGLDFRVDPGEWIGVMGPNDAGKTTLCLLLAGLAPHLTQGAMEGRVVVSGRDTRDHPPPGLADTVGVLFQEPEAQLFNHTVEAEVAWGLENLGLSAQELRDRVDNMLGVLRVGHLHHRFPGQLSGGEKKRVALAAVLAMEPSVLILDEPMGGLDPAGQRELLNALSILRTETRGRAVTIVMVETDPEPVVSFADRVLVLQNGRIALDGPPGDLFRRTEHLEAMGVVVPPCARLATGLNKRLGSAFQFLTTDEAKAELAAFLG